MNTHNLYVNTAHLSPLTEQQVNQIHHATLQILEETGIWVGNETLLEMARCRGLCVDGQKICFTEAVLEEALSTAANAFTLKARNPENDLKFALDVTAVGMGRSAPFIMTPEGNRRNATGADFLELMKLGQSLNAIQMPGPLVFPEKMAQEDVYAFMMAAQVRYSDKPCHLSKGEDLKILCMAMGITVDTLKKDADKGISYAQTTVNSLSPLALTSGQGQLLIDAAEHGIAICLSPTPATGSTGPCSLMGNLILNNCETLGMLILSQWVRPGLPVFYGAFPSASDMRTMSATYGGPESRKMELASALMAKHYNLLSRSNVNNDAQVCDFQAGAESMFNLVTAFQGQVNFIPGCGHLASFAAASQAKLILDAELTEYARYFAKPIPGSDSLDETIKLIQETGPRGKYVTSFHTFSHFREVLHHPDLFPRVSHDKWCKGRKSLQADAQHKADHLLEAYQQPPIDKDLDRRLAKFCEPGLGENSCEADR
ncbi:MttB7 [Desulforapulum autotrophicum HRM2]|uniref:MttB7 n=1 Tax=Desulforapulum autotrophicum (strain ATCC 43914 / DSM 3382 / VKM B-1955 / HRM2) TaxID=177437 RepID=C0QEW4_DESAH|nr:trimethylamine methyltransferase family protein [Desulforapulum autotrophicum]ACN17465.1 MttB7 [Desulforapulum autotrophicum HRM2]